MDFDFVVFLSFEDACNHLTPAIDISETACSIQIPSFLLNHLSKVF